LTSVAPGRPVLLYDCGVPEADALSNFDITRPHIARIYDYWLGGKDNFEVAAFFAGLEFLAPGVVPVQSWRPTSELDINSAPTAMWGGVGYKG